MKLVRKYNIETGLFESDEVYTPIYSEATTDEDGAASGGVELPLEDGYTFEPVPSGLLKPKFENGIWTEGAESSVILEQSKQLKVSQLKESYNTARYADIDYLSTKFTTDKKRLETLSNVMVSSGGTVAPDFYWVDSAGLPRAMTYQELQGLATAIYTRNQLLFNQIRQLTFNAVNAPDLDALNSVAWVGPT